MFIHMLRRIDRRVLEQCADSLRVLAHPQRLRIVELLETRRLSVGELAEELGRPQAVVSQHLARMRAVGLLAVEREGRSCYYRIANPACPALLACIREHFA
jgi:ArsR family transcriptional regulator